jgi:hypothetical protein
MLDDALSHRRTLRYLPKRGIGLATTGEGAKVHTDVPSEVLQRLLRIGLESMFRGEKRGHSLALSDTLRELHAEALEGLADLFVLLRRLAKFAEPLLRRAFSLVQVGA